MTDHPDAARRASDGRFRRGREELAAALRRLLGPGGAPEPLADADQAAALAAEARAAHRAAAAQSWAIVRRDWPGDDRAAVAALVHAVGIGVGSRPSWLVVPGREPQVAPVDSEAVLDNPLGFAALAESELVLLDRELPGGLWLGRHSHQGPGGAQHTWELEVWGAEPWLSAATRAMREQR